MIDGFYLKALPVQNENERNVGGVLCEVLGKDGNKLAESVVTLIPSGKAFTFEVDGRKFGNESRAMGGAVHGEAR